jgi:cellulose synthase/poly-beta-1,6-N-acetylglucosamine synthase-like glycosyltransferase
MTALFAGNHFSLLAGAFLCGFAFFGIAYTYVGYPLLLWIASRLRDPICSTQSEQPSLTIIIAASNEAAGIGKKLEHTLALNYPREKVQIIVVSDGSDDATDDIVRKFANRGVELVSINRRMGKTNAQNIAVCHAHNSVLIFSDATTLFDSNALRYLAGAYRDPSVGAVSGRYDYYDPHFGTLKTGLNVCSPAPTLCLAAADVSILCAVTSTPHFRRLSSAIWYSHYISYSRAIAWFLQRRHKHGKKSLYQHVVNLACGCALQLVE